MPHCPSYQVYSLNTSHLKSSLSFFLIESKEIWSMSIFMSWITDHYICTGGKLLDVMLFFIKICFFMWFLFAPDCFLNLVLSRMFLASIPNTMFFLHQSSYLILLLSIGWVTGSILHGQRWLFFFVYCFFCSDLSATAMIKLNISPLSCIFN